LQGAEGDATRGNLTQVVGVLEEIVDRRRAEMTREKRVGEKGGYDRGVDWSGQLPEKKGANNCRWRQEKRATTANSNNE